MRSLLPGDRVVSAAGIVRQSLVSASLLTSAMVVVGLAQLGGAPTSRTTGPPTGCDEQTVTTGWTWPGAAAPRTRSASSCPDR